MPQEEHAEDSVPVSEFVSRFPAAQDEQDPDAEPLYFPVAQLLQAEDSVLVAELDTYFPAAHDEQYVDAEPLYCPVPQLQKERSDENGARCEC